MHPIKQWTVQEAERNTQGQALIGLILCVSKVRLAINDLQAKLTDGRLSALAAPKHEANTELVDATRVYFSAGSFLIHGSNFLN
jgi:hypothetical protein